MPPSSSIEDPHDAPDISPSDPSMRCYNPPIHPIRPQPIRTSTSSSPPLIVTCRSRPPPPRTSTSSSPPLIVAPLIVPVVVEVDVVPPLIAFFHLAGGDTLFDCLVSLFVWINRLGPPVPRARMISPLPAGRMISTGRLPAGLSKQGIVGSSNHPSWVHVHVHTPTSHDHSTHCDRHTALTSNDRLEENCVWWNAH